MHSPWKYPKCMTILRMEEILHHLGWLKPYKQWDKPPINWCRISSTHRMIADLHNFHVLLPMFRRPGGAAAAALCAVSLRGSSRGALGHQAGARARR